MLTTVVQILNTALANCFNWFGQITGATGTSLFLVSVIFIFLAVRFLLVPLFGQGISDNARSTYQDMKNDNSSSAVKGITRKAHYRTDRPTSRKRS